MLAYFIEKRHISTEIITTISENDILLASSGMSTQTKIKNNGLKRFYDLFDKARNSYHYWGGQKENCRGLLFQ
jgi:hypothetical protein